MNEMMNVLMNRNVCMHALMRACMRAGVLTGWVAGLLAVLAQERERRKADEWRDACYACMPCADAAGKQADDKGGAG